MKISEKIFIKCISSETDRNLFIFPHAGANPASYIAILKNLKLDLNVYILSLPARLFQDKKNALTDFGITLSMINEFMLSFQSSEIYLLGHSMGSLFSYEVAKNLAFNNKTSLKAFGISALKVPDHRFKSFKISEFDDQNFKNYIEKFHFIPDDIKNNSSYYIDAISTLKNDFKIIDSYRNKLEFLNLEAKAFIFGFENDNVASIEDLIKWTEYFSKVQGPIVFPGGHFQIFDSLGAIIQRLLDDN